MDRYMSLLPSCYTRTVHTLTPLESPPAFHNLEADLMANLSSCLSACLRELHLRERPVGRSRVFHGKLWLIENLSLWKLWLIGFKSDDALTLTLM
jgi:hypothetical protein